jgi:hypothetical protein
MKEEKENQNQNEVASGVIGLIQLVLAIGLIVYGIKLFLMS